MRKTILTLLLPLICGSLHANTPLKITGTVTDMKGESLPYASVAVKEKPSLSTVTDRDGKFSINLATEGPYTLGVSHAGFVPQERAVCGDDSEMEFRLEEDAMNINTVVVTATRTPKMLKDVPVLTRVITASDIRKLDVTDIGDLLLAEIPAVEFTYSMNQQTSIDIGGFGGTSVLFLIDGERLAGETLDNVDYSRLNMDNVERVEIVKGAASSLYGSNAVGGVINIISAEPKKPWAVNVNSRYGSHNAWRNGVTASFDQGRWNSVTSFLNTSQDIAFLGKSHSTDNNGNPVEVRNYQYGFRTNAVRERLRFRASDKIDLIARGGYYFRERGCFTDNRERYRNWTAGLRMNYRIDRKNYLEVSYYFDQYDKSDYYTAMKSGDKVDVRNYSNIQNTARALYNHTFGGGHILTAGGDAMTDYLMSHQFTDNGSHKQVAADVFAQFDWRISNLVSLIGGGRLDYYSRVDKPRLSPKLAFMYKPGDFALRASYGGGFRAPTLKEMRMKFDMAGIFDIYGNPDLKSQTSHNFMLSGEYTRRQWSATVAGFYNMVNNRIGTVWSDALYGMQYINTGQVNVMGAEAVFSLKLPCGFSAKASYAYTHEQVGKNDVNTLAIRPHTAVLRLEYGHYWKNYGFSLSLSGRYMSKVDTYDLASYSPPVYTKVHYPDYTMWKLMLSQKIWRGLTLTAAVDNLFNYKTKEFRNNSPTVYGTTFSVGLSVNMEELFKK